MSVALGSNEQILMASPLAPAFVENHDRVSSGASAGVCRFAQVGLF
jgi:hypothetical protein